MASLGEKRRKQNKKNMLKGRKMAMLVKVSLGYKERTCLEPQTQPKQSKLSQILDFIDIKKTHWTYCVFGPLAFKLHFRFNEKG